jgi:glycosyltransferase involved in cell wall biosynthesis
MKIAILSTSFPRFKGDYIANFFLEIALRLARNNKVSVVCPHDKGIKQFEIINGVRIKRFKYMPSKLENLAYGDGMAINLKKNILMKLMFIPFLTSFLFKSIKEVKNSDIVIANFVPSALIGLFLRKIYKKPVILTVHRIVENKGIMGKINKYVFENVDSVIFNSSYTQKKLFKFAKPKHQKIIFVGIENDRFNQKERHYDGKRKLKIISIGRLIEKKGYCYLIDAISEIEKKYPNKLEVNIIGWGSLENSLNKQINKLGLQNINLLGGKPPGEIPKYLDSSDLFVLSSIIDSKGETETLGVVLMEAMASGLPVIGSRVGGIVDVISEDSGFFIEQKNTKDLVEKISRFLEEPQLIEKKSKSAIKRARRLFDWEVLAKQYLDICNEIIIK